ncbi:hypothetical protein EVAR_80340_1 [Eumeta japonica]|uniref:Uncharacterized protein n=1 Tax=Eumeta variegata TaxID=151549 RepID=A0A4C1WYN3_EUMVA|nr:hypothetical protein EVAR_80340_1 [Eumeta japonica]
MFAAYSVPSKQGSFNADNADSWGFRAAFVYCQNEAEFCAVSAAHPMYGRLDKANTAYGLKRSDFMQSVEVSSGTFLKIALILRSSSNAYVWKGGEGIGAGGRAARCLKPHKIECFVHKTGGYYTLLREWTTACVENCFAYREKLDGHENEVRYSPQKHLRKMY